MYTQTNTTSSTVGTSASSSTSQSETRLAVADILSTMANGEPITPSTYATLEGFSTGVLTQTTPTLTPTTLRSIEQTFIELQTVPPPHQIPHHNEAGFVPPVVNPHLVVRGSSPSIGMRSQSLSTSNGASYQKLLVKDLQGNSSSSNVGSSSSSSTSSSGWNGRGTASVRGGGSGSKRGRNMGGRRPAKYEKLTPEEEERRRVRRERNKLAAARCRKRRMDHTNSLIYETEGLEDHRSSLQSEIQELQNQKDELEFILEAHKVVCKLHKHGHNNNNNDGGGVVSRMSEGRHDHDHQIDIKPDVTELQMAMSVANTAPPPPSSGTARYMGTVVTTASSKPLQRPNSLALSSTFAVPHPPTVLTSSSGKMSLTEATGIAISTPSSGIFNFEALMEGGTGLTPVSSGNGFTLVVPTCSTQQRSSGSDLSSPDTMTPPKLVSL